MTEKSANKRLKITVVALMLAIVALVGALVVVWAATNHNMKVGFDVSYDVSQDVSAEIRSEYYVPKLDSDGDGVEDGPQTVTKDRNGKTVASVNGYTVFNAVDDSLSKMVSFGNIAITPRTKQVEYYFTVHSLQGEDFVQAAFWVDFSTMKNMQVDYYYYNTANFDMTKSASTIPDSAWTLNQLDNAPSYGFKMVKVVISVIDPNFNASSAGTFKFILDSDTESQSKAILDKEKLHSYVTYANGYSDGSKLTTVYHKGEENLPSGFVVSTDSSKRKIVLSGDTLYAAGTICLPANSENIFNFAITDENNISSYPLNRYDFKNIDTSDVTSMRNMFSSVYCSFSVGSLAKFNTKNVYDMYYMFQHCDDETLDLNQFNTERVSVMGFMFLEARIKYVDLSSFKTPRLQNMLCMFQDCAQLEKVDLSSFDAREVRVMASMFSGCTLLQSVNLSSFETPKLGEYPDWGSVGNMFYECRSLKSLSFPSTFTTTLCTNMQAMFYNCVALETLDISSFRIDSATSIYAMFYGCSKLKSIDVSNFDTSNVTNMGYLFQGCKALTNIDVSNFNTEKVTNMQAMFMNCNELTSLDLTTFSTPNLNNTVQMFRACYKLQDLDISTLNVEKVTEFTHMFSYCYELGKLDLTNFVTTSVTTADYMFYECREIERIFVSASWALSDTAMSNSPSMFYKCTNLVGAVAYNSSNFTGSMATTSGYLTLI